ncbi:hypothetical protein uan_049 [Pseudomonas phage UAntarctica]|nr:hypothetical protein uan_049 [Pseudomonas phage UAntarctica]
MRKTPEMMQGTDKRSQNLDWRAELEEEVLLPKNARAAKEMQKRFAGQAIPPFGGFPGVEKIA